MVGIIGIQVGDAAPERCLCDGNLIEGKNSGGFDVIDNGIFVENDKHLVSNNIIHECIDEGILFDASADECLANGNHITDCGGAAIDDLGTNNAKTGNYSRGNGSGIDVPNKAGNIEL